MTKKTKRNLIIIIVAIVMFVAFVIIRNISIKKYEATRPLNSTEDLKTARDVVRYVGGEYITEKESTDSNFKLDIYLKFNVDLYTDDVSNEDYYRRMVRLMAYTLKFDNFRLADEQKKILIAVVCDKESSTIQRTYINGYEDYFAREDSNIQYSKMENTKITDFNIQAPELISLINQNWNKSAINTEAGTIYNNEIVFNDNGIIIKNVYKKVFNIVFSYNYTGNVLNNINIKMTENLDNVIAELGTPTFDNREETNLIGYKGKDIYVFFSKNQISIYRTEQLGIEEFISIIEEFNTNKDIKKFVSSITSIWPDYDVYDYDEDYVYLVYSLKGIKIQFNANGTSKHGIIVYNNFVGDIEKLKQLKDVKGIQEIYFENEDLVNKEEMARLYRDSRG